VTPVTADVGGMATRTRWLFWADDDWMRVEMRLEARFDPAVDLWESSPVICDAYRYKTERHHLAFLAEFIRLRYDPVIVAIMGSNTSR